MTKVLRWPTKAERDVVIHIPVHPKEIICMVGQAPDQTHDPLAFSIWTTDHVTSWADRNRTGWDRSFIVTLTGADTPEGFDTWRGSWTVGLNVFHLFEKVVEGFAHD